MMLGAIPSRHDDRTLAAADYFGTIGAPPESVDYGKGIRRFFLHGSDKIKSSPVAAAADMIQVWTHHARDQERSINDDSVEAAYMAISGYKPWIAGTDTGCQMLDTLNYWRHQGIGLAEDRISAYGAVSPSMRTHVEQSLWAFGGLYLGLDLPLSAQDKIDSGEPWDISADSEPGSWGYHAVAAVAYHPEGLTVITWGKRQRMTWAWFGRYCSEAWAVVSNEWLLCDESPVGIDVKALNEDLIAIHDGTPHQGSML